MFQHIVQQASWIAAVVFRTGGRLVGEGFAGNEIAAAQVNAVDVHLERGLIDKALHQVADIGARGAAIGRRRRRVGEHQAMQAVHGLGAVEIHDVARGRKSIGEAAGRGEIGAGVDDPFYAQAKKFALRIQRQFAIELYAAAMMIAEESFGAARNPFNGLADLFRRQHQRAIFRIGLAPDAKAAADIMRVHPQLFFRNFCAHRKAVAHHRHSLRGNVEVVNAAFGIVENDSRLRLHRVARDAPRIQRQPRHMRGACESSVGFFF